MLLLPLSAPHIKEDIEGNFFLVQDQILLYS